MNELKPCPQEAEALEIIESMLDVADMRNKGPIYADDPPRSGLCRIPEEDAAILRQYIADRRAQPANEPLTLEQLREMDNEKVFVVLDDDVCVPALIAYNTEDCSNEDEEDVIYLTNNIGGRSTYEEMLDMGAKFYRRPPERNENDG